MALLGLLGIVVIIKVVSGASNLLCNETAWDIVSGQWAFNGCSFLLANQASGGVIWLGNQNWTNYNIIVTMQLLDPATSDNNAGVLFRAKSVKNINNGGQVKEFI